MKKKDPKKVIQSIIGLAFVLIVIISAFIFRDQIENYAATGYLGVFLACFAATATILLPAPGILVVIQYAQFLNPVIVILLGSVGTALGEMIGYFLGRTGNEIANINTEKKFFMWLMKKPVLSVFLFSLIPLPIFDVVGICAGMTKMNPLKFFVACFLGKLLKMTGYVLLVNYAKELVSIF